MTKIYYISYKPQNHKILYLLPGFEQNEQNVNIISYIKNAVFFLNFTKKD